MTGNFDWGDGSEAGLHLAKALLGAGGPTSLEVDLRGLPVERRARFLRGMAAMLLATAAKSDTASELVVRPFNPDWTLAPAAALRELMTERHDTVPGLAIKLAYWVRDHTNYPINAGYCDNRLRAVLAKEPMPHWMPDALEGCGCGKASYWRRADAHYRLDLAIGRTDTTPAQP